MTTIVGVRFREVGKIYYFDPGELKLNPGDNVIVDTVRGTEFGTVMIGNREVEDADIVQPLKVVRRIATQDDVERVESNREKEKDAFAVCKEKIKERGLEMKLISAEYTFDNAKILFYFTADGRVDFRELVKDLAAIFKIRIELRQVGVRDETKLMGGLGGCGRPLCCASYLSDFVPVSIRMAKEQNLSLNPQKISGVCGRLMCCLKNESDTYEDLNTRLPKDGGKVIAPDGREGIAETVNVLRERVRVLFTDEQGNREMEEFPASELKFTPRRKPKTEKEETAGNKKKSDFDETDETVDELIEEVSEEDDTELKALEIAEIGDVFGEDIREISEEIGKSEEGKSDFKKRHRKHRRRHYTSEERDGENAENRQQNERPNGDQNSSRNERQNDDQNVRRNRRPNGNRNSNRNRQPGGSQNGRQTGNGNTNGQQNGGSDENNAQHVNTDAKPQEHSENGENKHHGAHRRFRKRKPKNNPES